MKRASWQHFQGAGKKIFPDKGSVFSDCFLQCVYLKAD